MRTLFRKARPLDISGSAAIEFAFVAPVFFLFMMGIIGEYVGRLYMQSKARSLFIVKDIVAGPMVKDVVATPIAVPHDLVRG